MQKRIITILLIVAACAVACMVAQNTPADRGIGASPAYASPQVTARQQTIAGQDVGEVLVDGEVVFRIRTPAGGYTPFQRAQIVALRLEQLMGDTVQPEDVATGRLRGENVVLVDGQLIITADTTHAQINNSTPPALANLWAQRLQNVLAGQPAGETPTQPTPVAQKAVPILSVGTGTRVGLALVAGSRDNLDDVVAVAEVLGNFSDSVRVRALIPVSTTNVIQDIRRVPETAVIGVADIEL